MRLPSISSLSVRGLVILSLIGGIAAASATGRGDIAVVASQRAPLKEISERDLRRIFLGIVPESAPAGTRALFNDSDPDVSARFLRSYLFMTASHYRRLVLARRYSSGQRPLERAASTHVVARRLQGDPALVTFLPRKQLDEVAGVKEIAVK